MQSDPASKCSPVATTMKAPRTPRVTSCRGNTLRRKHFNANFQVMFHYKPQEICWSHYGQLAPWLLMGLVKPIGRGVGAVKCISEQLCNEMLLTMV